MKYWIFQSNQVLGPYDPDDLGRMPVFSPESLVCPEGRKGTSMGDWQRAGMVPDLSVALVRATQVTGVRTATLTSLPPEPTLKDLAALGSLQEKVAMLEDVVLQLQENLRAKDGELTGLHEELAGKDREALDVKTQAEALKRQSDELKRQIAGLEERLSSLNQISETLDKAVEAEKGVEHDVAQQGQTLVELSRELESLRAELAAKEAAAPAAPALPEAKPLPVPKSLSRVAPAPAAGDIASPAAAFPPTPVPSPVPAPQEAVSLPTPTPMPFDPVPGAPSEPLPTVGEGMAASAFGGDAVPGMPSSSFDPLSMPEAGAASAPGASFDADTGGLPSMAAQLPDVSAPVAVAAPVAAPESSKKKGVLIGAAVGAIALAAFAVVGGHVPGMRKPAAPEGLLEPAPLPAPAVEMPPPPPEPDARELAIETAKAHRLPDGKELGAALNAAAPSSGNLSPWMAEKLPDGSVQVNYFANGGAPGSPTIAYEFVVDPTAKTVAARNAAAKAVLAGKTAAPKPAPKPRPLKVKPKAEPKPEAEPVPVEESLDSLLGDEGAPKPAVRKAVRPASAPLEPTEPEGLQAPGEGATDDTALESLLGEEAPKPAARPKPARRAAPKPKAAKPEASDESLLDDLLQE